MDFYYKKLTLILDRAERYDIQNRNMQHFRRDMQDVWYEYPEVKTMG